MKPAVHIAIHNKPDIPRLINGQDLHIMRIIHTSFIKGIILKRIEYRHLLFGYIIGIQSLIAYEGKNISAVGLHKHRLFFLNTKHDLIPCVSACIFLIKDLRHRALKVQQINAVHCITQPIKFLDPVIMPVFSLLYGYDVIPRNGCRLGGELAKRKYRLRLFFHSKRAPCDLIKTAMDVDNAKRCIISLRIRFQIFDDYPRFLTIKRPCRKFTRKRDLFLGMIIRGKDDTGRIRNLLLRIQLQF